MMDLRAMAMGHLTARALHAAVELELPDLLADGPCSSSELAARSSTDEPSLRRLLRFLSTHGVVSEAADGRFALTAAGETLVSGRSDGVAGAIRAMAAPAMWEATGALAQAVRTGSPTLRRAGRPLYTARTPAEAAYLSDTMVGFHGHEPPAVLAAYDFASRSCVVDVGGSSGNLLAQILQAHPALRGILFDLPVVADQAQARIEAAGVAERCSVVSGSFFDRVPAGGDTYLLSHVLHDWADGDVAAILGRCRQAMTTDDELLVIEEVAAADAPSAATLDLILLTTTGGRSRTVLELGVLLRDAGFALEQVLPTSELVSVLQAATI